MQEHVAARTQIEQVGREPVLARIADPGQVLQLVAGYRAVGAGEGVAVPERLHQEHDDRREGPDEHERQERQLPRRESAQGPHAGVAVG